MIDQVKDYLSSEQSRNKHNAALYEAMLRTAFPDRDLSVLVGHHIGFEFDKDLQTENEIPSADALMFCHDIMRAIFGNDCIAVMRALAAVPVAQRDSHLATLFHRYHPEVSTI